MNYVHDQYLYGMECGETCPRCGCGWEPEFYEDNPYLMVWRCLECEFAESYYDGALEKELLDEGNVEKQLYVD